MNSLCRSILLPLALIGPATRAMAQSAPTSRPALQQLDAEMRSLYAQVLGGVAEVQLPPPRWLTDLANQENPLSKWDRQLDPDVRQRLQEELREGMPGRYAPVNATITTQPATRSASTQPPRAVHIAVTADGRIIAFESATPAPRETLPPLTQPPDEGDRSAHPGARAGFPPIRQLAVLLDDAGHLLVPLYCDRESLDESPAVVTFSNGRVTSAKFVGSDRQTNLTILRLDPPTGHPLTISASRPEEGSLVLVVTSTAAPSRLALWTEVAPPDFGVIVTVSDSAVAGFNRFGQFLPMRACRPVIQQLIDHGTVRRATLGVVATEVRRDDPARGVFPQLGSQPAIRIEHVFPGSPAEVAGLRNGDLILSLAGERVGDTPTFAAAISARDGKTDLSILRDGELVSLSVDLHPN